MDASTIFGILGVLVNAIWSLLKRRTSLVSGQVLGVALMALHFYLFGAITATVVLSVTAFQAFLAIPVGKSRLIRPNGKLTLSMVANEATGKEMLQMLDAIERAA